ncbi:MAG: hypothetical protein ABIS50_02685 [Luteolibacter sp.]|uniref:hypothetical protein n=1 Tax=Luteolibacter sp. TaxID=1962973 RepID=UPI003263250A
MKLIQKALLLGFGMAAASSSAMAAFTFTNGDMILGFQASGGTGASSTVYFNLGSGVGARDNPYQGLVGNISSALSSAYGANWYSRTDLYFGVLGNLNFGKETPGFGYQAPVNGDPSRTFYVSTPNSGSLYTVGSYSANSLGVAGNNFSGMEGVLGSSSNYTANGEAAIITIDLNTSPVVSGNVWSAWVSNTGTALNTFLDVQQNFGKGTSNTYADIQRIIATDTGANPAGVLGGGTFETTLQIGSNGDISLIPEVSSTLLLGATGIAAAFRRRRYQLA